MKKAAWLIALLCLAAVAWAAKPATIRISEDNATAYLEFQNGVKLALTSKPTSIRPGTYWTKSLRVVRKDDKGKAWELRGTGEFGSLANVTVESEQEKVLLIGKIIRFYLVGQAQTTRGYLAMTIKVLASGISGEDLLPGAIPAGKGLTPPVLTIKAPDGKVLAQLRTECVKNEWLADWRVPAGFTGDYDVEVAAPTGPFEMTVSKKLDPVPKQK